MDETTTKDIKNLFRLNKENKSIKDKITRDIRIHLNKTLEESHTRKLTIAINSFSSKNNDKEHEIHSKRDITEVMINDEVNKVIKEFL